MQEANCQVYELSCRNFREVSYVDQNKPHLSETTILDSKVFEFTFKDPNNEVAWNEWDRYTFLILFLNYVLTNDIVNGRMAVPKVFLVFFYVFFNLNLLTNCTMNVHIHSFGYLLPVFHTTN